MSTIAVFLASLGFVGLLALAAAVLEVGELVAAWIAARRSDA